MNLDPDVFRNAVTVLISLVVIGTVIYAQIYVIRSYQRHHGRGAVSFSGALVFLVSGCLCGSVILATCVIALQVTDVWKKPVDPIQAVHYQAMMRYAGYIAAGVIVCILGLGTLKDTPEDGGPYASGDRGLAWVLCLGGVGGYLFGLVMLINSIYHVLV